MNATNLVLFDNQFPVFEESGAQEIVQAAPADMSASCIKMASEENTCIPSNSEIMKHLIKIESKLENIDIKLKTLDVLESKVDKFERDLKSLWLNVHDTKKDTDDKLLKFDDRISHVEISNAEKLSKLESLEKENDQIKEDLSYLRSQSMRNNLIFGGISESLNEKATETENKLREHLVNKLGLAQDTVDALKIERAHRMGYQSTDPSKLINRKIVCKFAYFKDRETVRKQHFKLDGKQFFMHEQFPPEVVAKRKRLIPKLREARAKNHNAWISYDTLFIDGKPINLE